MSASQSCGYLPFAVSAAEIASINASTRCLVINGSAGEAFEAYGETRFLSAPEVELPEGLFWFSGEDGLVVHVKRSPISSGGAETVDTPATHLDGNSPLGMAFSWASHYWDSATPVPSPKFDVGSAAQHSIRNTDMVVRGRDFIFNETTSDWQYSVLLDGRTTQLFESMISPVRDLGNPLAWISGFVSDAHQFGATLTRAKLSGKFANTLYSFRATRTLFRAYQFKPIMKMLQTGKSRILIADEVGLGKTIEAGLVWTELEARSEANTVLIVCPAALVGKWRNEMEDRFGFETRELDASAMSEFLEKHSRGTLPSRFAYVVSMERIRNWSGLDALAQNPVSIDLLVMDEAHAMRNTSTRSYAAGSLLAQLASSVLFLSATPINLRQRDVFSLTGLLAPEDELDPVTAALQLEPNQYLNAIAAKLGRPRPDVGELRGLLAKALQTDFGKLLAPRGEIRALAEMLASEELDSPSIVTARRLISDLNALSTVITRTRKAEVQEEKPVREASRVDVEWTDQEAKFYSEFLTWCKDRASSMKSPLMFSMQMPLRLASASLAVARDQVIAGSGRQISVTDDESGAPSQPSSTYDHVTQELVAAAHQLPKDHDSKFDRLVPVLRQMKLEEKRALLFTFSKPTLAYLQRRLATEFRVAVLSGDVPKLERNQVMSDFRAHKYDFVLANRVASEGLDFEFCQAVINYDLPWNPMEVEQRIGRIDRIGQEASKIAIVNFVNERTVDDRIMIRLLERIRIFEDTIGELEPIINENMNLIVGTLDFTLSDEEREKKIKQVELALEEQRTLLNDVTEISSGLMVANDVDIAGLEEDLLKSGRYVGQIELANLIRDWASTDGGTADILDEDLVISGSPQMVQRTGELTRTRQRTHREIEAFVENLRQQLPFSLALNQERARIVGQPLLNVNHPAAIAAASVPLHRQARFARMKVHAGPDVEPGDHIVLMAIARNASRGGDEIWGEAVRLDNLQNANDKFDLVMSALATGGLSDSTGDFDDSRSARAVSKMIESISSRHLNEQLRRNEDAEHFRKSRRLAISTQYEKKIKSIESRLETMKVKGVSESVVRMTQGQMRMAVQALEIQLLDLDQAEEPEIELEFLAVCMLEVVSE
jgi:SNF2 family DNA or RNA helicase